VEGPAHADWSFGETEARQIQHPVLVVLGERSRTLNPRFEETYDSLLSWLPHAEGFVLPAAAHGLHLQNPSGMVQSLRAFLQRHPSA
jgi:pimeloyl-ACP methyl ester carboxylesterase